MNAPESLPAAPSYQDAPAIDTTTSAAPLVSECLAEMARRYPQQIAIRDPRSQGFYRDTATGRLRQRYREITFDQLAANVRDLSRGLVQEGVTPGTRLALLVPPSIEFITLVFALLRAGVAQILIDPGMGPQNLIRCLAEAQPAGFITTPLGHAVRWWYQRKFPQARWNYVVGKSWLTGFKSYAQLLQQGRVGGDGPASVDGGVSSVNNINDHPRMRPTDPAAIIFTTGSTGVPKGVLYRQGNFAAQVAELRNQYHIQPGEIDVPCFPLFGLFNAALGVTTVLPVMDFSRPASCDPRRIWGDAIGDNAATQSFASPAVWQKIAARYARELNATKPETTREIISPPATLKRVLSAGAPIAGTLLQELVKCLPPDAEIHTPYGATEALPVATISAREVLAQTWPRTQIGAGVCVGRKFAGIDWRVIPIVSGPVPRLSTVTTLPTGEIGELIVTGPVVTTEYVTRIEANALAKILDDHGRVWHRMGDAGYLDELGRFWFCGRVAHIVWTSGGPLFSTPIEEIFNVVPGVRRTALVGVGPIDHQRAILIVEPAALRKNWRGRATLPPAKALETLRKAILARGAQFAQTEQLRDILFHPNFPVDIRHNAKIFREKLAVWASSQVSGQVPE
ncbi:MAG: fatty acid CoA ligase family protein [Pirellulales bacterium]|nr:fatty acid CoA ligase family protein [Pirellulales bacterium]